MHLRPCGGTLAGVAKLVDGSGVVRFIGQILGLPPALPTGWTQDVADPANVDSHGGALELGGGGVNSNNGAIQTLLSPVSGGIFVTALSGAGVILTPDGVTSIAEGSGPCFTADPAKGATAALSGGGLPLTQVHAFAERIDAVAATTIGDGAELPLQWHHAGGDSLLDLSVPAAPAFQELGLYLACIAVGISGPSLTPGGTFRLVLSGGLFTSGTLVSAPADADPFNAPQMQAVCPVVVTSLPATIVATVANHDGVAARDFAIVAGTLVKIY